MVAKRSIGRICIVIRTSEEPLGLLLIVQIGHKAPLLRLKLLFEARQLARMPGDRRVGCAVVTIDRIERAPCIAKQSILKPHRVAGALS